MLYRFFFSYVSVALCSLYLLHSGAMSCQQYVFPPRHAYSKELQLSQVSIVTYLFHGPTWLLSLTHTLGRMCLAVRSSRRADAVASSGAAASAVLFLPQLHVLLLAGPHVGVLDDDPLRLDRCLDALLLPPPTWRASHAPKACHRRRLSRGHVARHRLSARLQQVGM